MNFTHMFYVFWTFAIPVMVFIIPRGYMLQKLEYNQYKLYKSMNKKNIKKPTTLNKISSYIPFYNTWKQMEIITGKATIYKINMIFSVFMIVLLVLSRIILPLTLGATKLVGTIGLYTTFLVIFWIAFTFLLSILSSRIICQNFNGQKYMIWTWFFPVIAVFNVAIHLNDYFRIHAEELGGVYDPN